MMIRDGKLIPDIPDTTRIPDRARQVTMTKREGWVCPKCGRVWSPTWFECQPCNKKISD